MRPSWWLIAKTPQAAGFTLIGGGPMLDLDKPRFDSAVQQFGRALPEVALFYFSAHGMQVEGVNWLVPVDANPTAARDLDFQMIDTSLVLRRMKQAGTKLNMLVLDACRNNPFAVRGVRASAGGLAEMRAPEGTLISCATQPGNVAADGATSNSPYTAALAGAQRPWLASSPISGNFYFFNGPVTIVAPAQSAPVPPAAGPTRRFDGFWDIVLNCPSEKGAQGYQFRFSGLISSGSLHAEYGVTGQPSSLVLDGPVADGGNALFRANGRAGKIEHNVEGYKTAAPGTPYSHQVRAHFEPSQGRGTRLGGTRSCDCGFTRR